MKNQSGAIKTNLELYRVVMGGSSGYRRLKGRSDDFSLQTYRQTDTSPLYIYRLRRPRHHRHYRKRGRHQHDLLVTSSLLIGLPGGILPSGPSSVTSAISFLFVGIKSSQT